MKVFLILFSLIMITTQVRSETIYVLSTVYVNQSDLSRYQKKWQVNTSISSDGAYYFDSMENCRRALKDEFLQKTADPELEVAANEIFASYPSFTLTFNSGGFFYYYECIPAVAK